jgi:hypothetical protein
LKILVTVCKATYAKMRWADLQGIGVIEPPRAGTLNRAKVCIAGILKHALNTSPPQLISIDIKAGEFSNSINPRQLLSVPDRGPIVPPYADTP